MLGWGQVTPGGLAILDAVGNWRSLDPVLTLTSLSVPAYCGRVCNQQEKVRATSSHWRVMATCRLLDGSRMIEINNQGSIYTVFFVEDGKQVLSGSAEGMLQRWRVDDGHEVTVGEPIRAEEAQIYAAALSPDRKWLVCGLRRLNSRGSKGNVRVWDSQTHEKVLDFKGHTNAISSVDISSDSTKFATGGYDGLAVIWSITSGERLVGPLQHGGRVMAVRFSPNGDRLATATAENPDAKSIRIYNNDNGQQLLDIPFPVVDTLSSPLTWSEDGRRLFAVSYDEVKCFDTCSGTSLSKWSIDSQRPAACIALARNQKFIVVTAYNSLSFWDTSTYKQIGTVINHASIVWSTALSPDDDCIVTGESNGKIIIRSLHDILPISYLTVNVSDQLRNVVKSNMSWSTPFLSSNRECVQLPIASLF